MSAIAASSGGAIKGACVAPVGIVRAEKSCNGGTSHGEARSGRESGDRFARKAPVSRSSRSGTKGRDPFWHGPRLDPSFAAHVIAQATAEPGPEGLLARSAYRAIVRIPRALLLDLSV